MNKQKSFHKLNIPKHPKNSKSTVNFGVQITERPKLSS